MTQEQKNNPLHGVKLEALLKELVDHYGWQTLGNEINLNCFKSNPSIKSSLKFLRRTEWAREKVERFYLYDYKRLPRARQDQFDVPPRKRVVSDKRKAQNSESRTNKTRTNTKPSARPTGDKTTSTSSAKFNPWNVKKSSKE